MVIVVRAFVCRSIGVVLSIMLLSMCVSLLGAWTSIFRFLLRLSRILTSAVLPVRLLRTRVPVAVGLGRMTWAWTLYRLPLCGVVRVFWASGLKLGKLDLLCLAGQLLHKGLTCRLLSAAAISA